jgi:hypothetical protein
LIFGVSLVFLSSLYILIIRCIATKDFLPCCGQPLQFRDISFIVQKIFNFM